MVAEEYTAIGSATLDRPPSGGRRPLQPSRSARLASLSAFFPVRDEEDSVVPLTEAILESAMTLADWTEVIIVDDGSRDRTAERADGLAAAHQSVRVIHHATGRGYGAAVRVGVLAARLLNSLASFFGSGVKSVPTVGSGHRPSEPWRKCSHGRSRAPAIGRFSMGPSALTPFGGPSDEMPGGIR
jgi:hypothetical protein